MFNRENKRTVGNEILLATGRSVGSGAATGGSRDRRKTDDGLMLIKYEEM